uniref:Uncharacterized protein n=1 Tax=viral metagenome TaxID=1070528 RepID=A0A6M3LPD8_9ZZZZ
MNFKAIDAEYIVYWDRKKALKVALKIILNAIFKGQKYYKFTAETCDINTTHPNQQIQRTEPLI